MPRITIFTPTYNRETLLPKLYDSLKQQTNRDFIWLVVDDGSKDKTEELFKNWQKEKNQFEICYIKKKNGGKHTAIEEANRVCKTDYIVCVDSDDYLTNTAVEVMLEEVKLIDDKPDVCGVVTRRVKPNGEPFDGGWPSGNTVLYFNELKDKYGFDTETSLLFKTKIVKEYHFPIFEDERFVTEMAYYNKFIYTYKMLATENLYYVGEYMPDGYTAQGMRLHFKNPKGYAYAIRSNAYYKIKNKGSLKQKIGYCAKYYAWCKVNKLNKKEIANEYKLGIYGLMGNLLKFVFCKKLLKEKDV